MYFLGVRDMAENSGNHDLFEWPESDRLKEAIALGKFDQFFTMPGLKSVPVFVVDCMKAAFLSVFEWFGIDYSATPEVQEIPSLLVSTSKAGLSSTVDYHLSLHVKL